jgi:hypothetical protein
MARDLDTLLKEFQALAAAAKEPGRLTPEQVDAQVERLSGELLEALKSLGSQLGAAGSARSALLMDILQKQLAAALKDSGLPLARTEKMKKLTEELQVLKRGFIRS